MTLTFELVLLVIAHIVKVDFQHSFKIKYSLIELHKSIKLIFFYLNIIYSLSIFDAI